MKQITFIICLICISTIGFYSLQVTAEASAAQKIDSSQWKNLPEEIQQSLNHTIFLSKKYLSSSNEKVQQRFIRSIVQYGELLGEFIHMSGIGQVKDQPDLKSRIAMLKNIPFFQGLSDYDLIGSAIIVCLLAVVFAIILGFMDFGFKALIKRLISFS